MTEESESPLPSQTQTPRHCPICGIRVAAKASECLMCGASLVEEEEEEPEPAEEEERGVPGWVGSAAVVLLAMVILGAGGFGLYTMLDAEPSPEPTTVAVAPSSTPTRAASSTPTGTPTDTPAPTSTPTPLPPRAHDVQEGETVSDIAELYGVTVQDILALNADMDPEMIRPGQVLLVPAATPQPGAAASSGTGDPEATPGDFIVHVVSAGETLSALAAEYDVSISVIRAANDLSPDDETIRAGQSLVIPVSTPTPTATATPNPNVTPTAVPPYDAPPLLYPPDGAVLDAAPVLLQWASIAILEPDEWYELYVWEPPDRVVSSTVRTRATAWRVPFDLLAEARGDSSTFRWRVQVVREGPNEAYYEAGAPSRASSFVWQGPTPTRSSSPTPTP